MMDVISFRGIKILREAGQSFVKYDGIPCPHGREYLRRFVRNEKIMRRMVYRSKRVVVERQYGLMCIQYLDSQTRSWKYAITEWRGNVKARRLAIARALREARGTQVMESLKHLGWRYWKFDTQKGVLVSPFQGTPWYTAQLRADKFRKSTKVEYRHGIHAYRMTRQRWIDRRLPYCDRRDIVWGVVEIGGRYVLGTDGLRCEVATIKHLATCDPAVAAKLVVRYPGVCVHLVGG